MARSRHMSVDYRDDLRLFRSSWAKLGLVALIAIWALAPFNLSDFQLQVLDYAGIFAIGAIGLNLLTGYTGQVSLGHAFFIGAGAYVATYFGVEQGWPVYAWLPAAAVAGAVIGAVVGPFALRLRGDYLAIITLGLVAVGDHVFNNWHSLTGGGTGKARRAMRSTAGFSAAVPAARVTPASAATSPAMPHDMAKTRRALMPSEFLRAPR